MSAISSVSSAATSQIQSQVTASQNNQQTQATQQAQVSQQAQAPQQTEAPAAPEQSAPTLDGTGQNVDISA